MADPFDPLYRHPNYYAQQPQPQQQPTNPWPVTYMPNAVHPQVDIHNTQPSSYRDALTRNVQDHTHTSRHKRSISPSSSETFPAPPKREKKDKPHPKKNTNYTGDTERTLAVKVNDKTKRYSDRTNAAIELYNRNKEKGIDAFTLLFRCCDNNYAIGHIERMMNKLRATDEGKSYLKDIILHKMLKYENDQTILEYLFRCDPTLFAECLSHTLTTNTYPPKKRDYFALFVLNKLRYISGVGQTPSKDIIGCTQQIGCSNDSHFRNRCTALELLAGIPDTWQEVFKSLIESPLSCYDKLYALAYIPAHLREKVQPCIDTFLGEQGFSPFVQLKSLDQLLKIYSRIHQHFAHEYILNKMRWIFSGRLDSDWKMKWRLALDTEMRYIRITSKDLSQTYDSYLQKQASEKAIIDYYQNKNPYVNIPLFIENIGISTLSTIPPRTQINPATGEEILEEINDDLWNSIILQFALEAGETFGGDGHYNMVHDWITNRLMLTQAAHSPTGRQAVRNRFSSIIDIILPNKEIFLEKTINLIASSNECPDAADQGLNRIELEIMKTLNSDNHYAKFTLLVQGYILDLIEQVSKFQNGGREAVETYIYNKIQLNNSLNLNNTNNFMLYPSIGKKARKEVTFEDVIRHISKESLLDYMCSGVKDSIWYMEQMGNGILDKIEEEQRQWRDEEVDRLTPEGELCPSPKVYEEIEENYQKRINSALQNNAEEYLLEYGAISKEKPLLMDS